jgi:hypothetical protein
VCWNAGCGARAEVGDGDVLQCAGGHIVEDSVRVQLGLTVTINIMTEGKEMLIYRGQWRVTAPQHVIETLTGYTKGQLQESVELQSRAFQSLLHRELVINLEVDCRMPVKFISIERVKMNAVMNEVD